MISRLSGTVALKEERYAVLDVNGVGYKVFTTLGTLEKLHEGEKTALHTYLAVRENALDLYGFLNKEELSFFELLITISGIGPKTALGIMNVASLQTLRSAVFSGDTSRLTKVSGIGKKNAEKIVLELKGKFESDPGESSEHTIDDNDVMDALSSLGYSERDARGAMRKIPKEKIGASERVKFALKVLSEGRK